MASRGEILDSDDEDSFSPLTGRTPVRGEVATHDVSDERDPDASRSRRAESTDPSFFRGVYEEHHGAAQGHDVRGDGNEHVPETSSHALPQHNSRPSSITSPVAPARGSHGTSNISSITDPVGGNRERRKAERKNVVDLTFTQFTTPGRPENSAAATEIWDFPLSQDPSPQALAGITTNTARKEKRKSHLGSSAQTPDSPMAGALPTSSSVPGNQESRPPSRKKRKVNDDSHEDVGLLVISRSEETAQFKTSPTVPNTSSGDVIPNTHKPHSTGLYVIPNTLTPSQKAQYKFISLSTEGDETPDVGTLPVADMGYEPLPVADMGMGVLHNSSDTVAFPTPTAYAVTSPKLPSPSRPEPQPKSSVLQRALARMKRRSKPVVEDPHSSPDVISMPTPELPRIRRQSPHSGPMDPLAMPSTISPPPRTILRHSEVQPMEEDHYVMPSTISPGIQRSNLQPLQEDPYAFPPVPPMQESELQPVQEEPPAKPVAFSPKRPSPKRRGREEIVIAADTSTSVREDVQPPKRGRGRPKRLRRGTVGDDDLQAAIEASLRDMEAQQKNSQAETAPTTTAKDQEPAHQSLAGDDPYVPPGDEDELQAPMVQTEAPPKKRRGRKKKEVPVEVVVDEPEAEIVPQAQEEPPIPAHNTETETPKPKRKRGRPRKPEAVVVPDEPVVLEAATESEDVKPSTVADRLANNPPEEAEEEQLPPPKKASKASPPSQAEDETTSALAERDNNASLPKSTSNKSVTPTIDSPAKENGGFETPLKREVKREETPKSGLLSSSQVGKVQYRVGLSRKSRIAPLLKSLRKP